MLPIVLLAVLKVLLTNDDGWATASVSILYFIGLYLCGQIRAQHDLLITSNIKVQDVLSNHIYLTICSLSYVPLPKINQVLVPSITLPPFVQNPVNGIHVPLDLPPDITILTVGFFKRSQLNGLN